jgi:adenosylcobinamide-GDP ribazoletransferase
MTAGPRPGAAAIRLSPLIGAAVGGAGGLLYWGAAEVWPSSIAVALAMLAMAALDPPRGIAPSSPLRIAESPGGVAPGRRPWLAVLTVLLEYNALMALSAAKLPYALPPNVSLGILMAAGHAVARALALSVTPGQSQPQVHGPSTADLAIALVIGFLPAALIGVPGLVGVAAAIAARMAFVAFLRRRPGSADGAVGVVMKAAEIGFYLGTLAAWSFI